MLAVEDDADTVAVLIRELRPRPASRIVLVGGLACLPVLAAASAVLDLTAAVNADLPFGAVIREVDSQLRDHPPARAVGSELRARLRERQIESDRFQRLTDREAAVLADLVRGQSATDISRDRPVALATVRSQIAAILHKLEVSSQTAAVALTHRACRDPRVTSGLRFHQNY